jgi:hypothetical protein
VVVEVQVQPIILLVLVEQELQEQLILVVAAVDLITVRA